MNPDILAALMPLADRLKKLMGSDPQVLLYERTG